MSNLDRLAPSGFSTQLAATRPRPSIAAIIRHHAARTLVFTLAKRHPKFKTSSPLSLCRTRALGGHLYRCGGCDHRVNVYNSCGDRHCPQCSGARRTRLAGQHRRLDLAGHQLLPSRLHVTGQAIRVGAGQTHRHFYGLLIVCLASMMQILREQRHPLSRHAGLAYLEPAAGSPPSCSRPGPWRRPFTRWKPLE